MSKNFIQTQENNEYRFIEPTWLNTIAENMTANSKKYPDDVPEEVKIRRLNEIIALQNRKSQESNLREIGSTHQVLVEGPSKKGGDELCGRASNNKMCVFSRDENKYPGLEAGMYADVKVLSCTSATLVCELV